MARPAKPLPNGGRPTSKDERASLLQKVTDGAEARPGVYWMSSEDGGVLYVGKSKRVRERLLGHFRAGRREKGGRILREARAVDWAYTPSEFAALREELRLIKLYRPRFNVVSKRDAGHYAFVHIGPHPLPALRVVRGSEAGEGDYHGPFIGPHLVSEAVREISDAFGLRDCRDDTPMRLRLSGAPPPAGLRAPDCIRHDVGKCLGPCVGACSAEEYAERLHLATAFLDGSTDGPIERFRREMDESRARLAYERAALFRDRIFRLERLRSQLAKIRFGLSELSLVYPVSGFEGDDRVYLVHRGTVRAEVPAPRTTADRIQLQALVDRVFAPQTATLPAIRPHEIEEILFLSAWFKRYPDELLRTWRPAVS